MTRIIFAVVCAIASTQVAAAQDGRTKRVVVPPHPSTIDASFRQFVEELKGIVARKDLDALAGILPESLNVSFDDYPSAAFLKNLRERDDERESFWTELRAALRLGPSCDRPDSCYVPYTFGIESDVAVEDDEVIVTGSRVRVRATRSPSAKVVAIISHEVVQLPDKWKDSQAGAANAQPCGVANGGGWLRVRLQDRREGWICSEFTAHPTDPRFLFEKRDGRWLLTAWAAGD
jgi:hypothetical protein